jgi:DNA-binding Lrp family transcriptional regulator
MKKILYNEPMEVEDSDSLTSADDRPNPVRPAPPVGDLDEIDATIVRELARDARIANNALADRVGIAPSTCLGRVRSLRERGVIRGYHADVDPAALGRPLQAMIAVRLQSDARGRLRGFVAGVAGLPEVLNVFFLAGKDDFLHRGAARPGRAPVVERGHRLHRDVADLRARPRGRLRIGFVPGARARCSCPGPNCRATSCADERYRARLTAGQHGGSRPVWLGTVWDWAGPGT